MLVVLSVTKKTRTNAHGMEQKGMVDWWRWVPSRPGLSTQYYSRRSVVHVHFEFSDEILTDTMQHRKLRAVEQRDATVEACCNATTCTSL